MPTPIAFYAPLKAPDHPNPSGDRLLARLFMGALEEAGFEVHLASRLRSRDPAGNPLRQQRLADLGERLATRLIRHWQQQQIRPRLWFTYHLYYKAPDWIGPSVCRALGIPYVCAEASWATSRATGPWALSHQAVADALRLSSRIFTLNPTDTEGLNACLGAQAPIVSLPPFVDTGATAHTPGGAPNNKQALAARWNLDAGLPWLISVGMMRPGDKLASYRLLAEALTLIHTPCQLLIAGDGNARADVIAAFAAEPRVRFLGTLTPDSLTPLLGAADLMVWPAVNEAFGMALLEAQAQGLPVIAGNERGVAAVVHHNITGQLVPPRNARALALAVDRALARPALRRQWRAACYIKLEQQHSMTAAARILHTQLEPLIHA